LRRIYVTVVYSECVFLVLGIKHATGMHHIAIFVLSGSKMFLHIFS